MSRRARIRRVVVTVDAVPGAERAFTAGLALAARLEAEVEARLVEDEDLHRLAGLPFARRFGPGTAGGAGFGGDSLAAEFRALAATAREELEREAARRRVRASFRVLRERIGAEAVAPGEGEVVFVAWSRRRSLPSPLVSPPIAVEAGGPSPPVRVFFDGTAAGKEALAAAAELGPPSVVVLHLPTGPQGSAALEGAALQAVGETRVRLTFEPLADGDPGRGLHRALSREEGGTLVLSRRQPAAAVLLEEARSVRVPVDVLLVL